MTGLDKIETVEEFAERLEALGQKGLIRGLLRTATALGMEGERLAKNNARIAPKVRTGRLWGSIKGSADLGDGFIDIIIKSGGSTKTKPQLGPVKYAAIQEFGGTTIMSAASRTKAGVAREPISVAGGKRVTIKANRYMGKAQDRLMQKIPGVVSPLVRSMVAGEGSTNA